MLPPDMTQIGEDRYRSGKNYDRTLRHFRRTIGRRGLIWRPIRGSADVKGVHIINMREGRQWDAMNIYESRGKVYLYFVRPPDAEPKKR